MNEHETTEGTRTNEVEDRDSGGAVLLDRLRAVLARYVVLPSEEAVVAVVLWIAATHAQPAWAHAPRLVIRAPEKRCGKSRLLDLIEGTCHEPLITVNASPAAVYRSLGTIDPPTLLIDEADTIFGPKAGDANEDLRGLLNAGHQRNRPTLRYDASRNKVERIPTFAMAALAGIGAMPDTIEDRAVVVRMRRRAPGETVDPYRARRDGPALRTLGAALNEWLRGQLDALEGAMPAMPVEDRAADTWEPLIAVADLAGEHWPDAARRACRILTADHDATTDIPLRIRLLMDCRTAFGDDSGLPTITLLERLHADTEAPWATYGPRGDGLTAMKLGNLLREYDIRSGTYRFGDVGQAKGYMRADFTDAWDRYCPPDPTTANDTADATDAGQTAPQDPEGKPYQPYQPQNPRSERYGSDPWYGSSRTNITNGHPPGTAQAVPPPQAVPGLTCENDAGTAGTAPPPRPTCIRCRTPLTYDDGTHTHPTCATA